MTRKVIALTGGIGSGKSAVSEILREQGFETLDCDRLARTVAEYPETVAGVQKLLGKDCVENGRLNRKAVRKKVFSNEELLNSYNSLFFGKIKELLLQKLEKTDKTAFVEIPVLSAFEMHWDEVWLIESDEQTRIKRVKARDNVDEDNVKRIMTRQTAVKDPTRVIINCGTREYLKAQVELALKQARLSD